MKLIILFIGAILFLPGCLPELKDDFRSRELVSSKGEKIYVNTLNWGVTGDHQMTMISHNKNRLKERSDSIGSVGGIEPFFYSFKRDTLTLFFSNEVSYKVKEDLKSINLKYVPFCQNYDEIRRNAYSNDGYYCAPLCGGKGN